MGKTVLITGATSGIGRAALKLFVEQGWRVIGTYHQEKHQAGLLGSEFGRMVKFHNLDLNLERSIKSFADLVSSEETFINILINNAGCLFEGSLKDTPLEEIDRQINVNLLGLIKLTKLLINIVSEQVINVSSQYGKEAHASFAAYCASKWGVRGFTKALAEEYPNLKILSLNPGSTKTRMNDFWEGAAEPAKVAKIIYNIAAGEKKCGSGDDVDVWKLI